MKIIIQKADVMHRMMMTTAWHGVKTPEAATRYDCVAAVEADLPMLENFWREGCADTDQKLREWLGFKRSSYAYADCYEVVLLLPNNWDDSQEEALKQSLEDYLTAKTLTKWMALTWPEQQSRYVDDAQQAMDSIEKILWSRKRPKPWVSQATVNDVKAIKER